MDTTADLQLITRSADSVVALWRRSLLVQIRKGNLTRDVLRHMETALRPLVASGALRGLVAVVEPEATVPDDEVRGIQRKILREMCAQPHVRVAAVIRGDGVGAMLNRGLSRLAVTTNPNVRIFGDVAPAVAWLAPALREVGVDIRTVDLGELVEQLRRPS